MNEAYRGWVEEAIEKQVRERQPRWTESIAVGCEAFVRDAKKKLGAKALGRDIIKVNGSCELRENGTPYGVDFERENYGLSQENAFYWDIFS